MSTDESSAGLASTETGQAENSPETDVVTGQEVTASESVASEQSAEQDTGTTATDSDTSEESFFNPEDIKDKPELMAAYKQMQGAFTKRMQGIKEGENKIKAYDAFRQDPVGNVQAMAKQLGFTISRGEAQQQLEQSGQDFAPDSWDDVFNAMGNRMEPILEKMFEQRFGPVVNQVQSMKKEGIEKFLDENAPDWRMYEDNMKEILNAHPTLANEPIKLYKMSVPDNVLESRATKAALKKMEDQVSSGKTSGISTKKKGTEVEMPSGPMSFEESVAWAKKKLASEGKVLQ